LCSPTNAIPLIRYYIINALSVVADKRDRHREKVRSIVVNNFRGPFLHSRKTYIFGDFFKITWQLIEEPIDYVLFFIYRKAPQGIFDQKRYNRVYKIIYIGIQFIEFLIE